jgi:hypothetical protein
MTELSLPERLVHAAEKAIEERAVTVFRGITGVESVEGYPTDLARAAVAATLLERANALEDEMAWCQRTRSIDCVTCHSSGLRVQEDRLLAAAVLDVRALEGT